MRLEARSQRDLDMYKQSLMDQLDLRIREGTQAIEAAKATIVADVQESIAALQKDYVQLRAQLDISQRAASATSHRDMEALTLCVRDILEGGDENTLSLGGCLNQVRRDVVCYSDLSQPPNLLEMADRRFVEIIASVDERFARWASAQDIDHLRASLDRLEEHVMSMEAKTRITESALGGNDDWGAILTNKFRELECRLECELERESTTRAEDLLQNLENLRKRVEEDRRVLAEQQKTVLSDSLSALKKKIKHEYLAQLIAKMEHIQSQIDSFGGVAHHPRCDDTLQHMNERLEDGFISTKDDLGKLQWELGDVRRTMDTMLSASMTEIQSLRSDLDRIRREKKTQLEERDNRIRKLETEVEVRPVSMLPLLA